MTIKNHLKKVAPKTKRESSSEVTDTILLKYKLKETDDQLVEKFFGKNPTPSNGGIILRVATQLFEKKSDEQSALLLLEKQLQINAAIATQIMEDIKNTLVPLL